MPCVMPFITPWVSAVNFAQETKRLRPRKHSPAGPNLEREPHEALPAYPGNVTTAGRAAPPLRVWPDGQAE